MGPAQVVSLLRCLELGLRTAADEYEKLIEPVNPFDDSFTAPRQNVDVDSRALTFYTRPQLITLLKTVDPGFDTDGLSAKILRERIADLVRQHFDAGTTMSVGGVTDAFSPPGIVSDPAFVEAAGKLQLWFEEHMPKREETIRAYYSKMGCDGRCVRPGGACPNAKLCEENLGA